MNCWGIVAMFLAVPWIVSERVDLFLPRLFLGLPSAAVQYAGAAAIGLTLGVVPNLGRLGSVTASPIRDRDTFMDAIEGISPGLWGNFIVLLAIFGVAMLIAGTVALALIRRGRTFSPLVVLCGAMAVPIGAATAGFSMMGPYFSLAEEAHVINTEMASKPNAIVACEALPHTASSLLYYLNARIHWVNAPFNEQYPQRVLGLGHDYFWDDAGLESQWKSAQRVYLIIDEDRLPHWQAQLPPGARLVNKSGTRLVLCNQ
jgi:hypothetical protein